MSNSSLWRILGLHRMKIVCFIDCIASGGAQRQICILAALLKRVGYHVTVLTYYPMDFFRFMLDEAGVPLVIVPFEGQFDRLWKIRKELNKLDPDVVISYLDIPNFLAELSCLPRRKYKLIVSERSVEDNNSRRETLAKFTLHRFADAVVANSYAQGSFIRDNFPRLARRTFTILNCVDLDKFRPGPRDPVRNMFNILVVARFEQEKTPFNMLKAMEILRSESPDTKIVLDWYGSNFFIDGKPGPLSDCYLKLKAETRARKMEDVFRIHNPVRDLALIYQQCSALCLSSHYEACPNVVCEAIACGRPVLATDVGDVTKLLKHGKNGLVIPSRSPKDVAETILNFASLDDDRRTMMGIESRNLAEQLLSPDRFIDEYDKLIKLIVGN